MSMICHLYSVPAESALEVVANPSGIRKLLEELDQAGASVSLEKSWHGLHFVLTGSAWGGEPPFDFIGTGGEPIGNEDVGYGPARVLLPDQVALLNAALSNVTEEEFARRFDLESLEKEQIYPQIWDEELEDLLEEYQHYLAQAKTLVTKAVEDGNAMIIVIR